MNLTLTFLGTGGSIPSPSRALPSLAVRRGGELLLFDCGEGTQAQMVRAGLSPLKVDAVFISHLHGDHFLGLAGLVQTMSLFGRTRPLEVYVPEGEEERIETLVGLPHYTLEFEVRVRGLKGGERLERNGYRLSTSPTRHGVAGLAFSLEEFPRPGRLDPEKAVALGVTPGPAFSFLKAGKSVALPGGREIKPEEVLGPPLPGRKVVYAVDTRPSEQTVALASGADVLVHDSMFGEELLERAREGGHSTSSEAAWVAREAGVKLLVLTHLSPRYREASVLLEQARRVFPNTVVAEDLMVLEVPLAGS
ncbi:MAG: ribonuclease Z [Candidatus Hadarchaeales archaeon]